jgi:hypothetical protein
MVVKSAVQMAHWMVGSLVFYSAGQKAELWAFLKAGMLVAQMAR